MPDYATLTNIVARYEGDILMYSELMDDKVNNQNSIDMNIVCHLGVGVCGSLVNGAYAQHGCITDPANDHALIMRGFWPASNHDAWECAKSLMEKRHNAKISYAVDHNHPGDDERPACSVWSKNKFGETVGWVSHDKTVVRGLARALGNWGYLKEKGVRR